MGAIHNALTRTQLSIALKAVLGATKSEGGLERFGETLQPTLDLWERPEWAVLRGERLLAGARAQGQIAAELSHIAIANPRDSGIITVILQADARAATGLAANASMIYSGAWTTSTARASLALVGNLCRSTDSRAPSSGVVQTEVWSGSDPANLGGVTLDTVQLATANLWVPYIMLPVVLAPDSAFIVIGATVNVGLDLRIVGYERQAQGGELV